MEAISLMLAKSSVVTPVPSRNESSNRHSCMHPPGYAGLITSRTEASR